MFVPLGSLDMKAFRQLLVPKVPKEDMMQTENQTSGTAVFKTSEFVPAEGYQVRNSISTMKIKFKQKYFIVAGRLFSLNCFECHYFSQFFKNKKKNLSTI